MKRVDGAPTVSAAQMGARGAAFSRAQGRATAANLRDARRQRRPGAGARRRPSRRHDRRDRSRLRLDRRRRSRRPRCPLPRACKSGGVAATAKHFPGLGAAAENTDFAVQRIGLSEADAARGRRGALPPLRRRRRRDGDAEHGDLPGLLAAAGCLRPPDRDRRAALAARLRGGLDHRRAGDRRGARTSAARPRRAWRRLEPAPTCCSSPTTGRPPRPGGRCCGACAAGALQPRRLRNVGRPRPAAAPTAWRAR